MEESKNRFTHKKELLISKKNDLLANKLDLQRQIALIDEEI